MLFFKAKNGPLIPDQIILDKSTAKEDFYRYIDNRILKEVSFLKTIGITTNEHLFLKDLSEYSLFFERNSVLGDYLIQSTIYRYPQWSISLIYNEFDDSFKPLCPLLTLKDSYDVSLCETKDCEKIKSSHKIVLLKRNCVLYPELCEDVNSLYLVNSIKYTYGENIMIQDARMPITFNASKDSDYQTLTKYSLETDTYRIDHPLLYLYSENNKIWEDYIFEVIPKLIQSEEYFSINKLHILLRYEVDDRMIVLLNRIGIPINRIIYYSVLEKPFISSPLLLINHINPPLHPLFPRFHHIIKMPFLTEINRMHNLVYVDSEKSIEGEDYLISNEEDIVLKIKDLIVDYLDFKSHILSEIVFKTNDEFINFWSSVDILIIIYGTNLFSEMIYMKPGSTIIELYSDKKPECTEKSNERFIRASLFKIEYISIYCKELKNRRLFVDISALEYSIKNSISSIYNSDRLAEFSD